MRFLRNDKREEKLGRDSYGHESFARTGEAMTNWVGFLRNDKLRANWTVSLQLVCHAVSVSHPIHPSSLSRCKRLYTIIKPSASWDSYGMTNWEEIPTEWQTGWLLRLTTDYNNRLPLKKNPPSNCLQGEVFFKFLIFNQTLSELRFLRNDKLRANWTVSLQLVCHAVSVSIR
jgi:hypothetical protein